jgi:hypothetical protein
MTRRSLEGALKCALRDLRRDEWETGHNMLAETVPVFQQKWLVWFISIWEDVAYLWQPF